MKRLLAAIAFGVGFGVVYGPTMYLLLRVLHWHFLLSGVLAGLVGGLIAFPVYRFAGKLLGLTLGGCVHSGLPDRDTRVARCSPLSVTGDAMRVSWFDNVRIRSTAETQRLGLAGKVGSVAGFTTPSATGIEAIGSSQEDFAIAVMFEEGPVANAWLTEELVEFVDHAPGTEVRFGNIRAVRRADGSWQETGIDGMPLQKLPSAQGNETGHDEHS